MLNLKGKLLVTIVIEDEVKLNLILYSAKLSGQSLTSTNTLQGFGNG